MTRFHIIGRFRYTQKRLHVKAVSGETDILWEERRIFSLWFLDCIVLGRKLKFADEAGFRGMPQNSSTLSWNPSNDVSLIPSIISSANFFASLTSRLPPSISVSSWYFFQFLEAVRYYILRNSCFIRWNNFTIFFRVVYSTMTDLLLSSLFITYDSHCLWAQDANHHQFKYSCIFCEEQTLLFFFHSFLFFDLVQNRGSLFALLKNVIIAVNNIRVKYHLHQKHVLFFFRKLQ